MFLSIAFFFFSSFFFFSFFLFFFSFLLFFFFFLLFSFPCIKEPHGLQFMGVTKSWTWPRNSIEPINNGVIISGEQWGDSVIHIHVSVLPQTPLPSRLPPNIEQSSMCSTVGPCCLSILNIQQCVHVHPKLPNYPFPPWFPPATVSLFSKSVDFSLFFK